MDYPPDLKGHAVTLKGMIGFYYHKENGKTKYEITLLKDLEGTFLFSDGKKLNLISGKNIIVHK